MVPALFAAALLLPSTPYGPSDLALWHRMLENTCPNHHIDDWMPERSQADLIGDFVGRLPLQRQTAVAKVAAFDKTCAAAQGDGANSCEKIVQLHALRKLGLLRRFTAYACNQSCSELAVCDRPRK